MSVHAERDQTAVSILDVLGAKGKRKLAVLTAYDFSGAVLAERSGADVLLVGDSLGMVMLGRKDTMSVTLDEMIHHCRAVLQGSRRCLVIGDMPFMTYERGVDEALSSAARLCREGGVRAVKLEGGRQVLPQVRALVEAGIPVCGHIGLLPQRAAALGGFKVQARTAESAYVLLQDALALQEAGCFVLVMEAVPAPVAARITARLRIPTIGIGAGPDCDGQVLVYHDVLGLYSEFVPKFVKQYLQGGELIGRALEQYVLEVGKGTFPGPEHSFSIKDEELKKLDQLLEGSPAASA
ncbi:MAG: 3-methyl-2-oxobutanoate hydroxymethyltransferase [Deltaproteobacteria bacterium]|jgi:3-methyl-2-oxobutanoate hydroxymethyltransferase|nr:3-methyl-2-oxobutanoate hydroxymethyltransferase [Deltaproteobacteria bacterium]